MSQTPRTPLEELLEAQTRWEGDATSLWRKALDAEPRAAGASSVLFRRVPLGVAAALLVVIGLAVAGSILPTMGKARSSARQPDLSRYAFQDGGYRNETDARGAVKASPSAAPPAPPSPDGLSKPVGADFKELSGGFSAERVVIRKATVEIQAPDVRAAFLKAALLVSEAGGEYVEQSSLSGGNPTAEGRAPLYANLTLRVAVTRMGTVLNQLRDLGVVTSENSGGTDVTAQAVDLEARVRNEERVEKELLELMSSRKDAPLKDILELREQISRVRENIERLTAQRDHLAKLASLATILVIIREPGRFDVQAPSGEGVGNYFTSRMGQAWHDGLIGLSNSISWIVGVIVGGALWWLFVIIVGIVLVRWLKRQPATSPQPPQAREERWAGSMMTPPAPPAPEAPASSNPR